MKRLGIFFSTFATLDNAAESIFHLYGLSDKRLTIGMTAFWPLSANSTPALPKAYA